MRILLTGASGFIGHYLAPRLLSAGHELLATGRGEAPASLLPCFSRMDITDPASVLRHFEAFRPEVIIHAAALSQPDLCARDTAAADRVNVEGTRNLLLHASKFRSTFLFLSTDFVFNGRSGPYAETDRPDPVNHYGRTKWLAEQQVAAYPGPWSIARTALVYGRPVAGRSNLLWRVRDRLVAGESIRLANDQVRTPTYVEDLAAGLIALLERRATGIFHLSGSETLTPYDMGCRIAAFMGKDTGYIQPVATDELKEPALRPPVTGFLTEKAQQMLEFAPVSFQEGMRRSFGSVGQ
ncbi:MAG: hypothetical protein RJA57_162 [Bacteroidota bacterium]